MGFLGFHFSLHVVFFFFVDLEGFDIDAFLPVVGRIPLTILCCK